MRAVPRWKQAALRVLVQVVTEYLEQMMTATYVQAENETAVII